jgi:hypothetical protein
MPKRRDGIMTIRIPTDEKDVLQAIADHLDVTLSDVVVKAARDFIAENSSGLKKTSKKNSPKVAPNPPAKTITKAKKPVKSKVSS